MKKIITTFLSQNDKLLHIIAGLTIGAFFATVELPIMAPLMDYPILPVILAATAKEIFDEVRYGGFDWIDLFATLLGGMAVQLMVFIK